MGQDYLKIINNPEIVSWAKQYLKKSNRVVWYLKQIKSDPLLHPCLKLSHYYAMNIPSINEYSLTGTLTEVLLAFNLLEKDYLASLKKESELIPCKKNEQILINFPDGFAWVNLGKSYCKKEAEAMGHCGNAEGVDTDTLLSLRKKTVKGGKTFWEPHLTFILKEDGFLGEMKGKQNTRPHEKYHKYIWELITHQEVQGIRGQGYLPENNFHLTQLPKEMVKKYLKEYPQKFNSNLLELIKNRDKVSFFKDRKVSDDEIVPWINKESVLLELINNGSFSVQKAAVKKIKNPKNLLILFKQADPAVLNSSGLETLVGKAPEELVEKIWDICLSKNSSLQDIVSRNLKYVSVAKKILKTTDNLSNPLVSYSSKVLALRFLDRNSTDIYRDFKEVLPDLTRVFNRKNKLLVHEMRKMQEAIASIGTIEEQEIILENLYNPLLVKNFLVNPEVSEEFKFRLTENLSNESYIQELVSYDGHRRAAFASTRKTYKSNQSNLIHEIAELLITQELLSEEDGTLLKETATRALNKRIRR